MGKQKNFFQCLTCFHDIFTIRYYFVSSGQFAVYNLHKNKG